ncbi:MULTISPECIES: hypothetical protein [unclassified Yoonia]|uniref:hypothetical protein n=1 Tax=unclassified Yoonia TaxID=2629118 RepID=UPI002AFFC2D0|nr:MULTISPECIES: hypothetical protein [unclassified Yoonia]
MTPDRNHTNEADRAAKAFYGLTDSEFAAQIAQICGNDRKLMQAFERTRDWYMATPENQRKAMRLS